MPATAGRVVMHAKQPPGGRLSGLPGERGTTG